MRLVQSVSVVGVATLVLRPDFSVNLKKRNLMLFGSTEYT